MSQMTAVTLEDRFVGCLLGLAVGDSLGACFEGQTADYIARRYPTPDALLANPPRDMLIYTDDTQMAIGVAEALLEDGSIIEPTLCRIFAANYVPSRGYGWGARSVLEAMEEGRDYKAIAETHFPGGSYGNGAAMRVAPVGLFFHDDADKVAHQAELSALPTHVNPLGIEGAQLVAVAVAHCLRTETLDLSAFFEELRHRCRSQVFRARLDLAATAQTPAELSALELWGIEVEVRVDKPGTEWQPIAQSPLKQRPAFSAIFLQLNPKRLAAPSYIHNLRPQLASDGHGLASVLAFLSMNRPNDFSAGIRSRTLRRSMASRFLLAILARKKCC